MARDFNGSTDVIKRSSVPTAVTDNFAMCCWYNTDAIGSTQTAFINGYDGGGSGTGYSLDVSNSGFAQFQFGFVIGIEGTTSLSTGTWYHVLVERSSGTTTLYLNGTAEGPTTASAPNAPTQTLAIGAGQNNVGAVTRPFDGRVAECAIWTRVLTSTEKTNLAAGYSPSFYPQNLVFYSKVTGQNTPEIDTKSTTVLSATGSTKATHPDFMKYPAKPNTGIVIRPRAFAPGLGR